MNKRKVTTKIYWRKSTSTWVVESTYVDDDIYVTSRYSSRIRLFAIIKNRVSFSNIVNAHV